MQRFAAAIALVVLATTVSCATGRSTDELEGFPCTARRNDSDGECIGWASATLSRIDSGAGSGSQLVEIDVEPASANCRFGGTRVTTGADANANQYLDGGEVARTQYICTNESEYLAARNRNKHTTLLVTTTEPSGSNCADGGLRVDVGVDRDESGTLEGLETLRTTFLCEAHCTPQNERVVVPVSATGSLDYVSGAKAAALVASTTADGDVVAWMKFDLGDTLSNRALVGARLFVRHLPQAQNLGQSPVLRVVRGPNRWASADDLSVTRMPRGRFLSNQISNVVRNRWTEIPLLLDGNALSVLSMRPQLSLGLDEVTIPTQHAAFYGASDPSTRPYLELEIIRCAPSE